MNKVFSGIDNLPNRSSNTIVTDGCIALEGGAFRGVYGEGVLDALLEDNINMRCTVGVSAGALNGMNYVAGQIGRSARVNLRYRHDKRYVGVKALRNNHGLIGFDFIFEEFEKEDPLDRERFFSDKQRFIAVTTNCLTGKTEYLERGICGDIFKAIQASASMPYISKMVDVDGIPYLDGGCSTNIPYLWPLENGFDKVIVVRTRPSDFRYEDTEIDKHAHKFYHAYPEFADILSTKKLRYNAACDEIDALEREGKLFVISPSKDLAVKRLERDMEKLGDLYYLGYNDAKKLLPKLKEYLNS